MRKEDFIESSRPESEAQRKKYRARRFKKKKGRSNDC